MSLPLHPFLLVTYFYVFLYASNRGSIAPVELVAPLGLSLLAVALLWRFAGIVVRDRQRSALIASALVLGFFTYGHLYSLSFPLIVETDLGSLRNSKLPWLLHGYLSIAVLAALAIGIRLLANCRGAARLTRAANVMAAILLLLPLASLVGRRVSDASSPSPVTVGSGKAGLVRELGYRPDIYFIVLDGYARADVLRDHYGYDNRPFVEELSRLGFDVPELATANFMWTFLSLSSVLNLRYVTDLAEIVGEDSQDEGPAHRLIRDSDVVRFLRGQDYRYVHVNSTFTPTLRNPLADEQVHCRSGIFQVEAYRVLVETTWLRVLDFMVVGDLAACHLYNFQALPEIAARPRPKFVFAHFIPPHHPYLFDRDGNVLRHATVANQLNQQERLWADREAYVEQLLFVNRMVLEAVRGILQASKREPVVLLVSDHGPSIEDAGVDEYLRARFANLAALHLPGASEPVPEDLTLVNVFRLLLHVYFGADLELLPPRQYASAYRTPYRFVDVTERLPVARQEIPPAMEAPAARDSSR